MWLRGMFFFPEAGWESGHHNGKTTQSSGEGIERGGGGGGEAVPWLCSVKLKVLGGWCRYKPSFEGCIANG